MRGAVAAAQLAAAGGRQARAVCWSFACLASLAARRLSSAGALPELGAVLHRGPIPLPRRRLGLQHQWLEGRLHHLRQVGELQGRRQGHRARGGVQLQVRGRHVQIRLAEGDDHQPAAPLGALLSRCRSRLQVSRLLEEERGFADGADGRSLALLHLAPRLFACCCRIHRL